MKHAYIVLLVITAAAPAFAQEQKKLDRSEATMGQTIYFRYCAACHGTEGRGDGPVAPGLVRKPIDLTALASKNKGVFPFDKVARSIDGRETPRAHGAPDMPVWGEVFGKTTGTDAPSVEAAVSRITHYVWSIQPESK
jgi:mono/diheme cytochrome c family protein